VQEDDPYTDMAKKLDKQNKRKNALNNATQAEEEKKMSSSEDEATSQKFERMASKIEENKEPLRIWSKRIKIAVALLFLASTMFMNGVFSGQNTAGEIVDRSFTQELMGWNNLVTTLRESWFAIVAIIVYLILSEYNKRLDAEEQ